jgi:hypothetical protein
MPIFLAIIIFSYLCAVMFLVGAGLFLLFKYSEYNEDLLVED